MTGASCPPAAPSARRASSSPAGRSRSASTHATEPFSLDNERPAHSVDVGPFWIGTVPVSNGQWQDFIGDGGYDRRELWSDRGWAHRTENGIDRPLFWTKDGTRRRFGFEEEVPPDEPVQHISYFEADAFARWERRAAADRD